MKTTGFIILFTLCVLIGVATMVVSMMMAAKYGVTVTP